MAKRLTAEQRRLAKKLEIDRLIHGRYQTEYWTDYEKQIVAMYRAEERAKKGE